MNLMKPQASKVSPPKDEPRVGFPGDAKQRSARIKAAIKLHRETLRRLAK
jgi:hypothetical protein